MEGVGIEILGVFQGRLVFYCYFGIFNVEFAIL
jgi:hypothetical protein